VGLGGLEPMHVIKCTTNEFRDLILSGRMLPEQAAACKECSSIAAGESRLCEDEDDWGG